MIYVNSCGHDSHHPKPCNIEHKRGVPDYLILLIKRESWIYLDGEKHTVAPNSLICFPPDTYIHYGCDAIGYNGSIFFRMPRNGIFFLNYCLRSVRFCILIIFTDCRNMSACFPIFFTVTPATESSLLMPFCIFSCMLYRKSWKKIPTIPACRSIILPSPDSGHRSTIIRRITGASRLWRILWP